MTSKNRILCPLDLSNYSRGVANHAKSLTEICKGSKIYLFHVINNPMDSLYDVDKDKVEKQDVVEYAVNKAKALLRNISDDLKIPGQQMFNIVETGEPYARIINFAEKAAIDLIVMSTHGRTGLSRVLMGSIAENIIRNINIPVLLFNRLSIRID